MDFRTRREEKQFLAVHLMKRTPGGRNLKALAVYWRGCKAASPAYAGTAGVLGPPFFSFKIGPPFLMAGNDWRARRKGVPRKRVAGKRFAHGRNLAARSAGAVLPGPCHAVRDGATHESGSQTTGGIATLGGRSQAVRAAVGRLDSMERAPSLR